MIVTKLSSLSKLVEAVEDDRDTTHFPEWKLRVWSLLWTGNDPVYVRCLDAIRQGAMSREF